jgi:hypothetical protein
VLSSDRNIPSPKKRVIKCVLNELKRIKRIIINLKRKYTLQKKVL